MILSREVSRWPSGRVRDEYVLLFGLRLGDFWGALALLALLTNGWWLYYVLWEILYD